MVESFSSTQLHAVCTRCSCIDFSLTRHTQLEQCCLQKFLANKNAVAFMLAVSAQLHTNILTCRLNFQPVVTCSAQGKLEVEVITGFSYGIYGNPQVHVDHREKVYCSKFSFIAFAKMLGSLMISMLIYWSQMEWF